MARTKKWSKESIKEYMIIAAGVLLILEMMLYTCVATQPNQGKSQEGPLSVIRELGTSSTDRENSAVHKNKEPGDEKNKKTEEKADTAIHVEKVDSGINTRDTHAPLDMNAPDEHSNSSFTEEEKEMDDVPYQTYHVVDMLRTACGKDKDTLKEMESAACLAYKLVTENNEELLAIKKKYTEYSCDYNLDCEKTDVLKEKIKTYYRNPNNITRIPKDEDAEYEKEMKEIDTLYEKICDAKEDKERALDEYIKAGKDGIEIEKNSNISGEDTLKHYSHAIEEEKALLSTIKYDLKLFKTIYNRDQLLYLVKGKEKWYYIEDENKTELLDEILKLHENRIEYLYNGINRLEDMFSIQKNALYIAEEVYSAYKAHYMATYMYKKEKKLRKYIPSGFQSPLETWV
ncbi:hypothetical protein NERG_00582 [Nematocida ausubeli]|uniref:Uncharacterized protein n=1 Tax=Nematocida ausubeli (strain ATCC PRA-371 / ERTm2) TaxID=1913371 RepID=H8ZAG1_NEMA1|nr:hypothetical protein NERG_00582 [Nematocida ausubeli]